MTEHDSNSVESAGAWVYTGVWRVLSDWFKVPKKPPTLPSENGITPDSYKPARAFIRYQLIGHLIAAAILGLVGLILMVALTVAIPVLGILLALPVLGLWLGITVLGYLTVHLQYDTTWYVMSDRSLRIRRGVWVIREMTFTYENIQNVKVQQGPMQRMFGISDLIVETAGSSGVSADGKTQTGMNQGRIEGVADAGALRDRVLSKLKTSREAGIGDEARDEIGVASTAGPGWTAEHIQALRAIRDELRLASSQS